MAEEENEGLAEATPGEYEEGLAPAAVADEAKEAAARAETAEESTFVEPPSYQIDYKGDCAYEVHVEVPAANKAKQRSELIDELQGEAEIPGFRRGRAPRKLLESKFGKALSGEVAGKLVEASFEKLVKDEKLRPIAQPEIEGLEEDKAPAESEPLAFTLKFEVAPRVELGNYRGLEVERPVVTVDEQDAENAIEEQRSHRATFETVEGEAAQEGDQVVIDFEGAVDGEPFDGGSASSYPYILGTQRFFPEFETALAGMKTGESKTFDVALPDNLPNEAIKGKTAQFTVTVQELKRRVPPPLDDAFAKESGFESLADMRANVAERLREGSASQSDRIANERLLQQIVENSIFEFAKTTVSEAVESEVQTMLRQAVQSGMTPQALQEQMDDLRQRAEERALNSLKHMVVLSEIAEVEGIEVTEKDFEREASTMAGQFGVDAATVMGYLASEEQRSSTYVRLLNGKAMDAVREHAKITDKEVPHDELENEDANAEQEKEADDS